MMTTPFDDFFAGKTILITGAAGTIGKELVRLLVHFNIHEIRLLDNNDSELFFGSPIQPLRTDTMLYR